MIRIGHGFDVHAFGGEGPIVIGGVKIPYAQGLLAHSDGDVALHALTDALLGAAALGDIGKLFPDTDMQYKGADSRGLLRKAFAQVTAQGYLVGNVDVTIIAQAPKMRSYIDEMRVLIAQDLQCDMTQVNVKATTTEKLGFTGRGEGIACEAVALLVKKTMMELAYLQTAPKQTALLKAEFADFVVKEKLGYDFSGEGEFVVVKVRKTNANTIFVGEKLAEFAGISARDMSYAGLKDRHGVTDQWFSLHMPGKTTPDFSRFYVEGVEILAVSRHQRKIRIGSLQGNSFEILLRHAVETDELKVRLKNVMFCGFPNYFMDQRFGHDGQNLTQALRWAKGEIQVKDRKKRRFYLSAARSEVFNLIVSARIQQGDIQRVLPKDIVQLCHSQSWFVVDENEDLAALQQRLQQNDIALTAALIGDNMPQTNGFEMQIIEQHSALLRLMKQERVKPMRRAMLMFAEDFSWAFNTQGLALRFFLPAGSYATALIRELVKTI